MKKNYIKSKFADLFDLPKEYVCDTVKISLTGFSEFEILNYKSLVEYEDSIIKVYTGEKIVKIEGASLTIKSITDDLLSVSGNIKSVVFE